jgi:hypothetical protein
MPVESRVPHDTSRTAALKRYKESLEAMPPSGGGGCHAALLGIANRGRNAGLSPDQIAEDLEAQVHGTRNIPSSEIESAVNKAFAASPDIPLRNTTQRHHVDGVKLLNAIFERGADFHKQLDLCAASPVEITWSPEHDAIEVLRSLYDPDDRLFIGARHDGGDSRVLPVWRWIERLKCGLAVPEHVIPNPLTGKEGHTRGGKPSFRADSCVEKFKFAVVEFDGMPLKEQVSFWAGVALPIVALITSGGRSIHGWIRIDAADADEWTQRVEVKLFDFLVALGADATCKNEARLSRMPGHFRAETNKWQRVLYLDPVGGPIIR